MSVPLRDPYRDCAGFSKSGKFLLILLSLGVYAALTLSPVYLSHQTVQRVAEEVFDRATHDITDNAIRSRITRAAAAESLSIKSTEISVRRESPPGRRIIHVDVSYPAKINYLVGEMTLTPTVQVTKAFRVNEAALTRHSEYLLRQEQRRTDSETAARRHKKELEAAWRECEKKYGRGNCKIEYLPAGPGDDPSRVKKLY
jgi:hypothetical protein